ncbi:hypothetical protein QE152_g37230 [Popillia japonica]|uniref:Uncharacterized protein n=1 Tax=Popillia japonica TaxID=7064 RepID=A0AAW1IB52_POPJA
MDIDYYKRQKELLELKQKLQFMKNKEKMNSLNETLRTLITSNNKLFSNLSNANKDVEYINENIMLLKQLLNTDNKINMKQECAADFRNIVHTMTFLLNQHSNTSLPKENLNGNIDKLLRVLDNCITSYNSKLYDTSIFFTNVQKLTNPNAMVERQEHHPNNQEASNDSVSSTITFSEAIASSPL